MLPHLSQVIVGVAGGRLLSGSKGSGTGGASTESVAAATVRTRLHELRRTWQAPPELDRSRPRELRLRPAGHAIIALVVLMIAGSIATGVLMSVKASSDHGRRRELTTSGRDTTGTVVRRWTTRGDNRKYRLALEYNVNGRKYTGIVQVGRGAWQRMDVGTFLPVRYLPADPALHVVPGWESNLMPLWLPYAVAGAMGLGAWLATRPLGSQRRLLSEGRPAPAIITRHEKTQHGIVAHFAFAQLSGAKAEGKLAPQRKPPQIGSVACVLYEPDRVAHHSIYPLSLVRAVHEAGPRASGKKHGSGREHAIMG